VIEFPDGVKVVDQDEVRLAEAAAPGNHQFADEDEGVKRIGFSVGNLKVHGVGALCSFGVAAATFCIFLLGGGRQQQQHNRQNHKIQLQMYADDEVGGCPCWQFHYFSVCGIPTKGHVLGLRKLTGSLGFTYTLVQVE
jgi:hypothetical protein